MYVKMKHVKEGEMVMSCGVEKTSLLCLLGARVRCRSQSRSAKSLAFARARQGMGSSTPSLSWSALSFLNWCDGMWIMGRDGC